MNGPQRKGTAKTTRRGGRPPVKNKIPELAPRDIARFVAKTGKPARPQYSSSSLFNCWPWTGSIKQRGYGRFKIQGKVYAAHRVAYVIQFGELDPHLDVDHRCGTFDCVNSHHLEAVCPKVNQQRRIERQRSKKT